MKQLRLLIVFTLALCGTSMSVEAQQRRVIGATQCSNCRITFERVIRFGTETGPGYVGVPSALLTWKGNWFLTHEAKPEHVSVYDKSGRFLKDLGKRGEGPGEFKFAGTMAVQNDTLHVYDHELYRISAFDSSLKFVRTFGLGGPFILSFYPFRDGFLLNGRTPARETAGLPLHYFRRDGTRRLSFGTDTARIDPDMPHIWQRVVSIGRDGTIWTARATDYVIEQWDHTGKKLSELRRNAAWFPPHGRAGMRSEKQPPNPTIRALWIDEESRAWVLIAVPDARWQSAIINRGVLQGRTIRGVRDYNRYYDALLEVIDLKSGTVIATNRLDANPWPAAGDGFLVTYAESDEGNFIEVLRPRVTQTTGR